MFYYLWFMIIHDMYYTWIILDQGYTVDSDMFIDVNLAHSLHTMKTNIQLHLVTDFIAPVMMLLGYIMIILTDITWLLLNSQSFISGKMYWWVYSYDTQYYLEYKCVNTVSTKVPTTLHVFMSVSKSMNFSSPLEVRLGDTLNIKCPPDATSNVWIQVGLNILQSH